MVITNQAATGWDLGGLSVITIATWPVFGLDLLGYIYQLIHFVMGLKKKWQIPLFYQSNKYSTTLILCFKQGLRSHYFCCLWLQKGGPVWGHGSGPEEVHCDHYLTLLRPEPVLLYLWHNELNWIIQSSLNPSITVAASWPSCASSSSSCDSWKTKKQLQNCVGRAPVNPVCQGRQFPIGLGG